MREQGRESVEGEGERDVGETDQEHGDWAIVYSLKYCTVGQGPRRGRRTLFC